MNVKRHERKKRQRYKIWTIHFIFYSSIYLLINFFFFSQFNIHMARTDLHIKVPRNSLLLKDLRENPGKSHLIIKRCNEYCYCDFDGCDLKSKDKDTILNHWQHAHTSLFLEQFKIHSEDHTIPIKCLNGSFISIDTRTRLGICTASKIILTRNDIPNHLFTCVACYKGWKKTCFLDLTSISRPNTVDIVFMQP